MSENEMGLREARTQFGDLVNQAQYARKSTIVTRHGRPAAMIVPVPQYIALRDITVDFIDRAEEREQGVTDWMEAAAELGYGFIVLATYDEGDVLAVIAKDEFVADEIMAGERMTLRIDRTGSQVESGEGDLLSIAPGPYDPEQHMVPPSYYPDAPKTVTLPAVTLVSATVGDLMPKGALELAESDLDWDDLPEDAQAWASEQGYGDSSDELLYVIRGTVELAGWPTRVVRLPK